MSEHVINVQEHKVRILPTRFCKSGSGNLVINQGSNDIVIGKDDIWGIVEWLKSEFPEQLGALCDSAQTHGG